jgi:lactoylglutathione lyase
MELGAFSVSLAVKDIAASKDFYEKLGLTQRGGDLSQNWAVMKNGNIVIGLFQGMFSKNILTFSPGWDQDAQVLERTCQLHPGGSRRQCHSLRSIRV